MTAPIAAPGALDTLAALRVSVEDHVATVVLRAAGKASRMGPAFWAEMPEAFAWLDASPDVEPEPVREETDALLEIVDVDAGANAHHEREHTSVRESAGS